MVVHLTICLHWSWSFKRLNERYEKFSMSQTTLLVEAGPFVATEQHV